MRWDRDYKLVRMIPGVKVTNTSASARTYGSGGHGTLGVVDTMPGGVAYDRCRISICRNTGTASKVKSCKVFFQSGAATLCASAYNASGALSGYTSGSWLASSSTSGTMLGTLDVNLAGYSKRKRYINALVATSTTSNAIELRCELYRGAAFPPSTTGLGTITVYG